MAKRQSLRLRSGQAGDWRALVPRASRMGRSESGNWRPERVYYLTRTRWELFGWILRFIL
jgi:hypothetical protein